MWNGDYPFLIKSLVLKDFRIRYRNMSLGVLWSLVNPIVMLGLMAFIFTRIFSNSTPHFAVFLLCGLIPFNFFTLSWLTATSSVVDNAMLVKRVNLPRELVPLTSVLSNCLHLAIQIGLLVAVALLTGVRINIYWLWLPPLLLMEIAFVCGLGLATSALNVHIRDTRYVVESANVMLFWLVPIFYSFEMIPAAYKDLYQYNPIAAIVLAMREIILKEQAPSSQLMLKALAVSTFSIIIGLLIFRRLKPNFYDHI